MAEQVALPLPPESHGIIRMLLARTKFTPARIADFSALMLEALERNIRVKQYRLRARLTELQPQAQDFARISFEPDGSVIEFSSETGEPTGRSVQLDRAQLIEFKMMLDDIHLSESCQGKVGHVAPEMEAVAEQCMADLQRVIVRYVPEVGTTGDWVLDDQNMMMIKRPPIDEEPTADQPAASVVDVLTEAPSVPE